MGEMLAQVDVENPEAVNSEGFFRWETPSLALKALKEDVGNLLARCL